MGMHSFPSKKEKKKKRKGGVSPLCRIEKVGLYACTGLEGNAVDDFDWAE